MRGRRSGTANRSGKASRPRPPLLPRRNRDTPAPPPEPEPEPEPPAGDPPPGEPAAPEPSDLFDERRLRGSGGPEDTALYSCACGMVWRAQVTASVRCPHCGAAQAW